MQQHYIHGVPRNNKLVGSAVANGDRRIAIVFRRGLEQAEVKDSGEGDASLEPRVKVPNSFGNCIECLREGSLYKRRELVKLGAFG